MIVKRIKSRKGLRRQKINQTSTFFIYEVGRRLLLTLISIVVRTNITVTLRVMIAGKKLGLK